MAAKLEAPKHSDLLVRWAGIKFALVEEAPRIHRTIYNNKVYFLPMSWMYYRVNLVKPTRYNGIEHVLITNMYTSPVRCHKNGDLLYAVPLTNIYEHERPCYYYYGNEDDKNWGSRLASSILAWEEQNHNTDNWQRLIHNPTFKRMLEMADETLSAYDGEKRFHSKYKTFLKLWESLSLQDMEMMPYKPLLTVKDATGSKANVRQILTKVK